MAKEYVQCTLQTDTRQQMRYKKIGEEIHGKKNRKSKNKSKKEEGGVGKQARLEYPREEVGGDVEKDYEFWYSRNSRNSR